MYIDVTILSTQSLLMPQQHDHSNTTTNRRRWWQKAQFLPQQTWHRGRRKKRWIAFTSSEAAADPKCEQFGGR